MPPFSEFATAFRRSLAACALAAPSALSLCLLPLVGLAQSVPDPDASPSAATPAAPSPPADTNVQPTEQITPRVHRRDRNEMELDETEIVGVKSDAEQRRESTAAKIVVGREEIERFGDSTLDEVLKRLPSVSIVGRARRGGSIVMRGMGNGYTQILINGERIPPGFAIDQLVPDQVERIEIYRAPTAETGARAIAGTINIVLREALRTHINEVRIQAGDEAGRGQSNLSWIRNDVLGDKGTYNVTLSAAQADFFTQTATRRLFTDIPTGDTQLDQDLNTNQVDHRDNLHFTSRLQWQLDPGEQLIIQPFFTLSKTQTAIDGTLDQSVGMQPEPYANSLTTTEAQSALARVQLQYSKQWRDGIKLELHGSLGAFTSSSDSLLNEFNTFSERVLQQITDTDIRDHSGLFTVKVSDKLDNGHSLVAGGEVEALQRDETASTIQNGVPLLAAFGSDVNAQVLRTALYAQDDWTPAQHWAADAGLRWEDIDTESQNKAFSADNNNSVLTPLAHVVWRFDEPARDQLRLSITRSYRSPTLQNLISLPTVNTLYPVTEENVASAPDSVGNPNLKPELATGLDVALEHYDLEGGVMSISAFDRDIHDLIRTVTMLEPVLYSTQPRWVAMPVNFGNATTQGIEMDAKFRLDTIMDAAIPVTLNANLSVFRSHVDDVFGPNNRINQQPNAIANLGGDYTFKTIPWRVGGNVSWTPPFTVQTTNTQSTSFGLRRQMDMYALWTLDADTKLRFSLTNFLPVNYITGTTTIQGAQSQSVLTNGKTTTLVAVRLELRI